MYAHSRTPDGGPPRNSHAVSAPSLRICRHQSPLSLYADPRPLTRMPAGAVDPTMSCTTQHVCTQEPHCSVVPLGEPAEWLQRLQVQLLPCVTASHHRLHFGRRLHVWPGEVYAYMYVYAYICICIKHASAEVDPTTHTRITCTVSMHVMASAHCLQHGSHVPFACVVSACNFVLVRVHPSCPHMGRLYVCMGVIKGTIEARSRHAVVCARTYTPVAAASACCAQGYLDAAPAP